MGKRSLRQLTAMIAALAISVAAWGCSRTPAPRGEPTSTRPQPQSKGKIQPSNQPITSAQTTAAQTTDTTTRRAGYWQNDRIAYDGTDELWLRTEALVVGQAANFKAIWSDHRRGEASMVTRMTVLTACAPGQRLRAVGKDQRFQWRWTPLKAGSCRFILRGFGHDRSMKVAITLPIRDRGDGAIRGGSNPGFVLGKRGQWADAVRSQPVQRRLLRRAIRAAVTLESRPDGVVAIRAPAPGRIGRAGAADWPATHRRAKRGDALLSFALETPRRLRGLAAAWLPVDRSRRELDAVVSQLTLHSPISGSIARVTVHPGQRLIQGDFLLEVHDESRLNIRIAMSPQERSQLGDNPQLLLLPAPEPTVVVAMNSMRDDKKTLGHVLINLDNHQQRWRAGQRVAAVIEVGPSALRLALSAAALQQAGEERYVFVQLGGDRFERRTVHVGRWSGDAWAVSDGLRAGERVVISGIDAVRQAQSAARR